MFTAFGDHMKALSFHPNFYKLSLLMKLWLYRTLLDKIGVHVDIVMYLLSMAKNVTFFSFRNIFLNFYFVGKNSVGSMPQLTADAALSVSLFSHFSGINMTICT